MPESFVEKWVRKKSVRTILVGLLSVCIAAVAGYYLHSTFNYSRSDLTYYPYTNLHNAYMARIGLYAVSSLATFSLILLMPDRKIPCLTAFGKYSLFIFLYHIVFCSWFSRYVLNNESLLSHKNDEYMIILVSLIASFLMCLFLGNRFVAKFTNAILNTGADLLHGKNISGKMATLTTILMFVFPVVFISNNAIDYALSNYKLLFDYVSHKEVSHDNTLFENSGSDPIDQVMTPSSSGQTGDSVCANSNVVAGEICDDANTANNDGCSADCKLIEDDWNCPQADGLCLKSGDVTESNCGINTVEVGEIRDYGN